MLLSLVYALVPVLLGGSLAFLSGRERGWMGPLRTLALAAAVTVVLVELLPTAAAELGALALGLFLLGLVGPSLAERVLHRVSSRGATGGLGLEFAFLGLAAHQIVDGLQVGAARAVSEGGLVVALAIAAHSAPLVASAVLSYVDRHGPRIALRRAAWLAAATALGVCLGHLSGAGAMAGWTPWIQATLAGLLLHILGHDLACLPPRGAGQRGLDLAAVVAGVAAPLALIETHEHTHGHAAPLVEPGHLDFAQALLELTLASAPALLAGLALAAAVQAARLPLSIQTCGVLPLSRALWRRGVGAALVAAFLIAAPGVGLETFALTARLLGVDFALLRLASALALAAAAALAVGVAVTRGPGAGGGLSEVLGPGEAGPWPRRFAAALDELMAHVGPWMLAGLLVAAILEATLPAAQVAAAGAWATPLVGALVAPAYVSAASITPLAAVLWEKGMAPGALLAGLLLGPSTNLAALGFLRAAYGARAAAVSLLTLLVGAWALSFAADALLPAASPLGLGAAAPGGHGALVWAAAAALGLLALRGIWRAGVRGWLLALVEPGGAPEPGHHGHHHAHHHHEGEHAHTHNHE